MNAALSGVPGVEDLQVEPQVEIPQLRIEIDGQQLHNYGLRHRDINEFVETAMNGKVVSEVLIGQRTFDLLVRLDEPFREDIQAVKRLTIDLPGGGSTSLASVARVYQASGPEYHQPRAGPAADRAPVQHVRPRAGRCGPRHQGPPGADRTIAAHRLLRAVRRPIREPAVGLAGDGDLVLPARSSASFWFCTPCSARRTCRCR